MDKQKKSKAWRDQIGVDVAVVAYHKKRDKIFNNLDQFRQIREFKRSKNRSESDTDVVNFMEKNS